MMFKSKYWPTNLPWATIPKFPTKTHTQRQPKNHSSPQKGWENVSREWQCSASLTGRAWAPWMMLATCWCLKFRPGAEVQMSIARLPSLSRTFWDGKSTAFYEGWNSVHPVFGFHPDKIVVWRWCHPWQESIPLLRPLSPCFLLEKKTPD